MKTKTRKLIWSVPLVATLAIVGALVAFVALGLPNADPAEAQDGVFTTPPTAPGDLTTTAQNGAVTVSWAAAPDTAGTPTMNGYRVQYADVGTAEGDDPPGEDSEDWKEASGTAELTRFDLSHQVTGLTNGRFYHFRVAAVRRDADRAIVGTGPYVTTADNSVGREPEATHPGKPMNVNIVQVGDGKIRVTWDPPTDNGGATGGITGYVAQIRVDDNPDQGNQACESSDSAAIVGSGTWRPNDSDTAGDDDDSPANDCLPMTPELTVAATDALKDTRMMEWARLTRGVKYDVRVFATNSEQNGLGSTATTWQSAELATLATNNGIDPDASITLAEAADISLLTFTGTIESDSTTGSGAPQLTVTIPRLSSGLPVGSSIVLYLEDDFQEPDSIPASSVYFIADRDRSPETGNGSPVRADVAPRIETDDYFDPTKKDISIQVFIPDMCTSDSLACQSADGPKSGQRLRMVIEDTSGIKNPSEQGKHSAAFRVLGPGVSVPGPTIAREDASAEEKDEGNFEVVTEVVNEVDTDVDKFALPTVAKVSLSDENNARGYELLVTGSGFNDKTTATAYVMTADAKPAMCQYVVDGGSAVGSATVGSDDKVSVTVTVSVPAFKPGKVNHICLVDGEGRTSGSDVETFELEDSIRVVPATVNAGDTVTIFGQDFKGNAPFSQLDLQGKQVSPPRADTTLTSISVSGQSIGDDGSSTVTFEMPGSIDGGSVQGVIAVKAYWGTSGNASTTITVAPARLALSKTEALPNESITIQGNGFGDGAEVAIADITIDDVALLVDDDSHSDKMVDVSSGGQFVATVHLWPEDPDGPNPLLVSGTHTIKVVDDEGFVGTATITIPEPMINVVPAVAGPRDFINISGENWPVDNLSGGSVDSIDVTVEGGGRSRIYSALIDNSGRFNVEHRVASNVSIPSTNQIKVEYGSEIVKISEYKVPAATIMVEPAMAKPGDPVTLSVGGMPVHAPVDSITIGGRAVLGGLSFNTDRTGAVSAEGIVVPGLDPGTYAVQLDVGETVAIGSIDVQAEGVAGVAAALPGALEELGDSLVVVWHFNSVDKEWTFYDPRPEVAEFNTLSELVDGQAYQVLVSADVTNVVLNGQTRNLTCSGDNCWNQVVW